MPRRAKGPRLYLRKRWGQSWWVIRDGASESSTGCGAGELEKAERALATYLADKYEPPRTARSLSQILIADVMTMYLREHAPSAHNVSFIKATAEPIIEWWGEKCLADIRGATCREYVAWRTKQPIRRRKSGKLVSDQTARHDLKTMRAAINHYHREYGPLPSVPSITLPEKAAPRERWLERTEARRFLMAARRDAHVYRFIVLSIGTATRHKALLGLRWMTSTEGGWIDLDRALVYRRPDGKAETKKRQTTARLPDRLLPLLRRWRERDMALGITHVIHFKGRGGLDKMRRAWATARAAAGLGDDVTPHVLRHTAITWALQAGVPQWEVAGWAGSSLEMLDRVYGHHSPDHQKSIARRR